MYLSRSPGKIIPGDTLVEIDGVTCYAQSIERVSQLILGPSGSWVQLGFQRLDPSGTKTFIRIQLQRRPFVCPTSTGCDTSPLSQQSEQGLKSGILRTQRSNGIIDPGDNKSVSFEPETSRASASGFNFLQGRVRKASTFKVAFCIPFLRTPPTP